MSKQELQKLSDALYYQLNERISFVEPKEKIVAQLLFDLGNIAFLLGNYNDALADYEQATKYGFNGRLIGQRAKEAKALSKVSKRSNKPNSIATKRPSYWIYGLIGLGIAAFTTFIIIRNKRTKKNNS